MTHRSKKIIRRSLITIIIIYILGGIVLYFIQDLLIFHPTSLPKDHKFSFTQPFEEENILFDKENLSIIKFRPSDQRKGIVLFFHGNMENVEHYAQYPSLFTRNGFEVWMIDYPGFGKSTGKRTEDIMYRQAEFMYDLAREMVHPDSILIYGKSLGTAPASYLASVRDCKLLVLETPFYNMPELAKEHFPIYSFIPLVRYSFPNNEHLKKISVPVFIFHGTNDKVVSYEQGKRLSLEKKNVQLITIPGGTHNDLFSFYLYQRKMDSVLR
jgi:pimeloyl-ACP methyl ester carboxylesterase